MTSEAKRPGGKHLGGETTRGGNGLGAKCPGFSHFVPIVDSPLVYIRSYV